MKLHSSSRGFRFTFATTEDLLYYFDELGVTYLFLPYYDRGSRVQGRVRCHRTDDGFRGTRRYLLAWGKCRPRREVGPLVVDIVPNHVGSSKPEHNTL
ncbi:hypothetical protein DIJ64_06565 [Mycobacterium leprae]|uniref:Uncharacterized protein n=1 Tax=Mycobacterium leprae TaxID=1769 RepID=A0AAD0KS26_MYCLR|nr:hypothetical protein DIJ64_06565 [Mycobacterium leprae]OAR20355.1 hypothetical protein A8144_11220 [Mycobacterium leprae 3125609]OAX70634.1 hypothetical protein A3216_10750 [Mycobacterium leprae 7935681]